MTKKNDRIRAKKKGKNKADAADKKLKPKKKKFKFEKRHAVMGFAAFVLLLFWMAAQPRKGTVHFSICKTFAELKVAYPETMRVTSAELTPFGYAIYYSQIDPYGISKSEKITCKFAPDESQGLKIIRILQGVKPLEDQEAIDNFNRTIPAIISTNPEFIIPPYPGNDLKNYKKH